MSGTLLKVVYLIALLKRKPELSPEEFRDHWRNRHGPLIRSTPEIARHIVDYRQYLPADSPMQLGPQFDGMTVIAFESADEFAAFIGEPLYTEVIAPDEQRFLDLGGLVAFLATDPEAVIDGRASIGG